jgi:hypothetical protein
MRDRIEVSRNGRSDLQDAHRYCGVGNFTETSNGNRMAIGLRAGPFSRGINRRLILVLFFSRLWLP